MSDIKKRIWKKKITDLKVIRKWTDRQTHASVRDTVMSLFIAEHEKNAAKIVSEKYK